MATAKKPEIEIIGLNELRFRFGKLDPEVIVLLKALHLAAAEMVVTEARPNVPRRSGSLAATVRAGGIAKGAVARAGFASVPYAGPIHWGWPGRPNPAKRWRGGPIRAKEFLFDASHKREPQIVALYDDRLAKLVDQTFPD